MVLLEHSWRMFLRQCVRFQQFSHNVNWLLQYGPFFSFSFQPSFLPSIRSLGIGFPPGKPGQTWQCFFSTPDACFSAETAFSAVFAQCVKWPFAGYRKLLPLCFYFQMSLEQIITRMVPCLLIFLVLPFGAWWPDLLTLSADQPWRDAIEILRYDSWYDEYALTTAQNMVHILHLPSFFSP